MMFGSIHPSIALEAMYQLRQINFQGHLYFDTFPQRTDPVKEVSEISFDVVIHVFNKVKQCSGIFSTQS